MLPGTAESYWMDSTPSTAYPPLAGDLSVDVAVIGGGIAGLCTAWELVQTGQTVAVLEADRIAASVSGYTTAKLSSLHTLIYAKIRRSFGPEAARLYAQSQQQAVERVEEVCGQLGIDCELERLPGFTYVESPELVDQVRAEVDAANEAGLPASFVTETGLPSRWRGPSGSRTKRSSIPASTCSGLPRISAGAAARSSNAAGPSDFTRVSRAA